MASDYERYWSAKSRNYISEIKRIQAQFDSSLVHDPMSRQGVEGFIRTVATKEPPTPQPPDWENIKRETIITREQGFDYGYNVGKDWQIKLTPETGGTGRTSLINPDGWEVTDDSMTSPKTGNTYGYDEQIFFDEAGKDYTQAQWDIYTAGFAAGQAKQQPQPEGTDQFPELDPELVGAVDTLLQIFSPEEIEGLQEFDDEELKKFTSGLRAIGRTKETEAAFGYFFRDPETGEFPPEEMISYFFAPLEKWNIGSYNLLDQSRNDLVEFGTNNPRLFNEAFLYEGRSDEHDELLKDLYGETFVSEKFLDRFWLDTPAGKYVRGAWLPDFLEDYWKIWHGGLAEIPASFAGSAEYIGAHNVAHQLNMMGAAGRAITVDVDMGEHNSPEWFAKNFLQMIPAMLALIGLSLVTAGAGGAVASAAGAGRTIVTIAKVISGGISASFAEGNMEASGGYKEAKARGLSEEEAKQVYNHILRDNVALLSGSNTAQFGLAFLMPASAKFLTKALIFGFEAASEGFEEGAQLMVRRSALGDPQKFDQEFWDNFNLGLLGGLAFGTAGAINTRINRKIDKTMTPEERTTFKEDVSRIMNQEGISEAEAIAKARDKFAATPEGEAKVTEAVQETVREEQSQPETNKLAKEVREGVQLAFDVTIMSPIAEEIIREHTAKQMPKDNKGAEQAMPETGKPYKRTLWRGVNPNRTPTDEGIFGEGTYYTTDRNYADNYASSEGSQGQVLEHEVELKNPYVATRAEVLALGLTARDAVDPNITSDSILGEQAREAASQAIRSQLEAQGYDGIVMPVVDERSGAIHSEVVVFKPELQQQAASDSGSYTPNPEPVPQPVNLDSVVRRSDMIKELETKLGVPIRRGGYREKAWGVFYRQAELIRIKWGSMRTVAHEVGHYLDERFQLSQHIDFTGENYGEGGRLLEQYGETDSPIREAFAEYIRQYITNPERVEGVKPPPTPVEESTPMTPIGDPQFGSGQADGIATQDFEIATSATDAPASQPVTPTARVTLVFSSNRVFVKKIHSPAKGALNRATLATVLSRIEAYASREGLPQVEVVGLPQHRSMYERAGFVETGKTIHGIPSGGQVWTKRVPIMLKSDSIAPRFHAFFENWLLNNPDINKIVQKAKADYGRWMAMPDMAKFVSRIQYGAPVAEKISWKQAFRNFYTGAFDRLYPIQAYVKRAKKLGLGVHFLQDPYAASRLLSGIPNKVEMILKHGTINLKHWSEKSGRFHLKYSGKGLSEILKPVKKSRLEFGWYLAAKRTLSLRARGLETAEHARQATDTLKTLAKNPDYANFEEVAQEIYAFQERILDYGRQAGLYSQEDTDRILAISKDYVPFHRIMERLEATGQMGKTMGDIRSPLHEISLEGAKSELDIADPLDSIVKDTYTIIDLADRNMVGLMMAQLAQRGGTLARGFFRLPTPMAVVATVTAKELGIEAKYQEDIDRVVKIFRPRLFNRKDHIMTVLQKGDPVSFEVDPDLYDALLATDVEDVQSFVRWLSLPAKWLRAGAVLSPDFWLYKNPVRDTFSAMIYSRYGFWPIVDTIRGAIQVMKKGEMYQQFMLAGGGRSMVTSFDRKMLHQTVDELLMEGEGLTKTGWSKFKSSVMHPLDALERLAEYSEMGTRMGEFMKGINKGASPAEAAFAGREVSLDFAVAGAQQLMRALRLMIPFWNAAFRGMDKISREAIYRPHKLAYIGFFGLTLPTLMIFLINVRDEETRDKYLSIPRWERDKFWIILLPNAPPIRIPKPFDVGYIFATLPERVAEYIITQDKRAWNEVWTSMAEGIMPSFLPTVISPAIEDITNWSFFRNQDLIGESLVNKKPRWQYNQYTPELYKKFGDWLNWSPIKIDNYLRAWTGGLGNYVIEGIDLAFRKVGLLPDPPKPAGELADIPIVRAFIGRDPYGSSSDHVAELFDMIDKYEAEKDNLLHLLEAGYEKRYMETLAKHPEIIFVFNYATGKFQSLALVRLNEASRKLQEIREAQRNAFDDLDMSSEDKRLLIDELNLLMANTAKNIVDTVQHMDEAAIDLTTVVQPVAKDYHIYDYIAHGEMPAIIRDWVWENKATLTSDRISMNTKQMSKWAREDKELWDNYDKTKEDKSDRETGDLLYNNPEMNVALVWRGDISTIHSMEAWEKMRDRCDEMGMPYDIFDAINLESEQIMTIQLQWRNELLELADYKDEDAVPVYDASGKQTGGYFENEEDREAASDALDKRSSYMFEREIDPDGLVVQGNLDLRTRPNVYIQDDLFSGLLYQPFEIDGKEVLLPTLSETGEQMKEEQIITLYRQTGQHLGIFESAVDATRYAMQINNDLSSMPSLFKDARNEIEALSLGMTDEQMVEDYVHHKRIANQYGGSSSQAIKDILDHPALHKLMMDVRQDDKTKGWGSHEDAIYGVLDIDIKWHNMDNLYKWIGEVAHPAYSAPYTDINQDGTRSINKPKVDIERQAMRDSNLAWTTDVHKRNALKMRLPEEFIDRFIAYNFLPEAGYKRERMRAMDTVFDLAVKEAMMNSGDLPWTAVAPLDIPPVAFDELKDAFSVDFKAYDDVEGTDDQKKIERANIFANPTKKGFKHAWHMVNGYDKGFGGSIVSLDNAVGYVENLNNDSVPLIVGALRTTVTSNPHTEMINKSMGVLEDLLQANEKDMKEIYDKATEADLSPRAYPEYMRMTQENKELAIVLEMLRKPEDRMGTGEVMVKKYATYHMFPDPSAEKGHMNKDDERYLKANQDLYELMMTLPDGGLSEPIDFGMTPSEALEDEINSYYNVKANEYESKETKRKKKRCQSQELDAWLVKDGNLVPMYGTARCTGFE